MKRFMGWIGVGAAIGVSILAIGVAGIEHIAHRKGPAIGTVAVDVPTGTHARAISRLLAQRGVIRNEWMFTLYVRFAARQAQQLQAGHYRLKTPLSPRSLVAILKEGRPKQIRVTILEGGTKQDIARWIAQAGLADADAVLAAMESEELRREFGVPERGAGGQATIPGGIEGYLYPDTYLFDAHSAPTDLLRAMHSRLLQALDTSVRARMEELRLSQNVASKGPARQKSSKKRNLFEINEHFEKIFNEVGASAVVLRQPELGWSLHHVLTLASLVQQETPAVHERPLVAGVFHNRLLRRPPMRLQCDPTVRYGLETFQGFYPPTQPDRLRTKDLRNPHLYNTYAHGRLPPGPIGSSGREAIRAALWPAHTKHLYFVSKNDGTHVFCPTYNCHKRAVQRWQINFTRGKKRP